MNLKKYSTYYSLKKFYSKAFLLINIPVAAAVGLSYLSIYISPEKAWYLAFFGLAYPYILIANLFFILIWLLARKIWFMVSLLCIMSGYNHFNDFFQFTIRSDKILKSGSFKVISYNVRLFDLYNWGKNWTYNKKNRNKIFEFIRQEQPEIICFQEFFSDTGGEFISPDTIARFMKAKNYHDYYTAHNRNHNFGIATFTAYPIVKKGCINFPHTNNICIYTDIKINRDTFRIYNCHLASLHFHATDYNFVDSIFDPDKGQIDKSKKIFRKLKKAFMKRAQQVDIISEEIKKSPYPVIVCGDFNDAPISYAYHKMRGSLSDAFEESGNGTGNTYRGLFISYRIDYILHSKKLKSYNFSISHTDYSDHYPVKCFFEISKK
ncbi:MAG: endonuclease/exonuclease/phosphatase family protein [Bacteroidia bacterium]|nr:endonuclease/exonuclease/phosphatase family protein [Bacteroidia bacterium]